MSVIAELLKVEEDGTLSFGNYDLEVKSKLSDFEFNGDLYKVKTFKEITKLERNGMFVYESVPGTAVNNFFESDSEMKFQVEGVDDAQITVEAENGAEYKVYVDDVNVGTVTANLGGKLVLSVELNEGKAVNVKLIKE
ncbi:MAG: endosialidase [Lachnospiraceae bacterium]|nr:endosialidase [Lachnospiraceae bacterium]